MNAKRIIVGFPWFLLASVAGAQLNTPTGSSPLDFERQGGWAIINAISILTPSEVAKAETLAQMELPRTLNEVLALQLTITRTIIG
jgi:hypothetical protein